MAVFNVLDPLENISLLFTEEQLSDIIAWFDSNAKPCIIVEDGEPVNVITVEKLIKYLELKKIHRRSFHYPSYAEIMNDIEKLKAGVTRVITRDQFIYILNKCILMPDIKHELKLAFKVFDTENRNFLEIDDIKVIVTRYAEVFNENETREMLRDAHVRGDGNVFYEDFVESLFSVAPELYQLKAEYLYENPDEDPTYFPEPVIEEIKPPTPPPTQVEAKVPSKKEKKK